MLAKCHLCRSVVGDATYCEPCGHWFCAVCNNRWLARGWAALKAAVGGRVDGCCGPVPVSSSQLDRLHETCVYLGPNLGKCCGDLPLFECGKHGLCLRFAESPEARCCAKCDDFQAAPALVVDLQSTGH